MHKRVEIEIERSATYSDGLLPSDALPDLEKPDNAAIATRDVAAGERLYLKGVEIGVSTHDILEGHRFAVCEIKAGEDLRSWGISFGVALKDIHPGEYLCNVKVSSKRGPDVQVQRMWYSYFFLKIIE